VKKYTIAAILFFLISDVAFGKASGMAMKAMPTEKSETCNDAGLLANSLHVQRFEVKERFDVRERSKNELLKLLGVKVNQEQNLYFFDARRISGECVAHLDDINLSIHHFDTGVTLIINDEGSFIPNPKRYRRRPVVSREDAHPEIAQRQFIEAVEIGWGYFVGIWEQNGKSIMTYYKEIPSGEFRVHDDMLISDSRILIIRRVPHLDTPSCAIQILLQNNNDRVVLDFIWVFPDDMD